VLDEPTAVLAPAAIERLFGRLRALNESGVTLFVILHKLAEVFELADTVTVLRDGMLVMPPTPASRLEQREVSDAMIGPQRAADDPAPVAPVEPSSATHRPRIELRSVTSAGGGTEPALVDVSLSVGEGRIVGVAGVEGNGQRRVANVLAGLEPIVGGEVWIDGSDVTRRPAADRRRGGLRIVPFDRNVEGTSQTSRLWENFAVRQVLTGASSWVSAPRMRASARDAFDEWGVRYRSTEQVAGDLSGGNVQRLILARELAGGARALIAAHPTRGLDFRATEFVRVVLRRLAATGAGVLLISSDLDELFEIADELVVFRGGRLVESFGRPYDRRSVGDAMLGVGQR
jgi:simple sugar transport system ATP-binding protein